MMFELTPFGRRNHGVSNYNPFHELEQLEKEFFSDRFLGAFKTDIKDTGDAYVLEADLPGFKKEDIHVNIDDHYLTVSAQRHTEAEQKDKKGNYVRCERSYGSFERSFDIRGVEADKISGCYKDGVLQLTMPKKAGKTSSSREIDIQ